MIHPFDSSRRVIKRNDGYYQIVAWENSLQAFDPSSMLKTVLLGPSSLKVFNRIAMKMHPYLVPLAFSAIAIRTTTFVCSASVGRVLAPVSILLQLPGMVFTVAHMRTEYVKILLCTFDFWFLQAANTLWAVTFSVVLNDSRVVLVIYCWFDFTFWLLQEAYLRNTYIIVGVALYQWVFYLVLTAFLSLELVDEVHHRTLITSRGHTLSSKDVLTNTIGTMTTLSLRILFRRYQHLTHERNNPGKPIEALGYRSKIMLISSGPTAVSITSSFPKIRRTSLETRSKRASISEHPLLQMCLAAESARIDPCDTVWPGIGKTTPLPTWIGVFLHIAAAIGGWSAGLALFLPKTTYGENSIAVCGLMSSVFYCGIHTCCQQRQLLKRVVTSFHFLFIEIQIIAIGLCVIDMFSWRCAPICGVISNFLLGYPVLASDALTPIMKQRLQFKHWMVMQGIAFFLLVHTVLLVDVLVLGSWELQDRVFLDSRFFGHHTKFRVVPFLLSRVITIAFWSVRNGYVALTRPNDNAFILLRGNVEFDYEGWKKQTNVGIT